MIDPATSRFAIAFVLLFLFGRFLSLGIYQVCWRNAIGRDLERYGAFGLLVRRVELWPLHALMVALTFRVSWIELGCLYPIIVMTAVTLTWGAVFRLGAADLQRFFLMDRLIAVLCCIGVIFSPAFFYPTVMLGCALQYTVSRWPLGPGYSNLLGFEMIRGSASVLLGCMIAYQVVQSWVMPPFDAVSVSLSVWICVLASYYVNHALAKAALGRHWCAWVFENRLECLFVNAYLRGWRAKREVKAVLDSVRLIRPFRVLLCGSAFLLELGFIVGLADRRWLTILLIAATVFHFGVFLLTGLAEIEFAVNHLTLIWLLMMVHSPVPESVFGLAVVAIAIPCIVVNFAWVGTLRRRLLRQFQTTSKPAGLAWADPFDHLMAWWDSPYMRMFTYVGVTESGERLSIPVSKLSPYDTALTDLHTHMMLFNLHADYDPLVERDKKVCQTGVWGLIISESDRDEVYSLMDQTNPDLSRFDGENTCAPWQCRPQESEPHVAAPLQQFFRGTNHALGKWWFRQWMRYPHFPGEDLVPDRCPLSDHSIGEYRFDRRIAHIEVERVKTFYTGDSIKVIEHSVVGRIDL